MTQQEQFEADYLASSVAAVPDYDFRKTPEGDYVVPLVRRSYRLWLQQARRHEEELSAKATTMSAKDLAKAVARGESFRIVPTVSEETLLAMAEALDRFDSPLPCDADLLARLCVARIKDDGIELAELRAKAEAQAVPADSFPHEELDAIALARFKVEPTNSNVWGWCVRAGSGKQELYKGRKSDCAAVARSLTGAFLDGAWLANEKLYTAPPAQAVSVPSEPLRTAPEGWVWRLIPISEDWPPC